MALTAAGTHVVAIDLGGTKLSAAVVDGGARLLSRNKWAVDKDRVAQQIVDAVHEVVQCSGLDVAACGLIVPGIAFPVTGEVWAPNLFGHDRVPLAAQLRGRLPAPLVIDSDRSGYVLGERWAGCARGLSDVVFLAVGTGIGAGIVSGGMLIRGAGEVGGAVGWFALSPRMDPSYKLAGCWEAEAAGPAVARRAGAPSAEEVVAAARSGDRRALGALAETARWIGMGIANLVSLLNPQMIVLGGGLMQAGDLMLDAIRREMIEWAQPIAAQQVRIELSTLGEDAGLLGAARLALDQS